MHALFITHAGSSDEEQDDEGAESPSDDGEGHAGKQGRDHEPRKQVPPSRKRDSESPRAEADAKARPGGGKGAGGSEGRAAEGRAAGKSAARQAEGAAGVHLAVARVKREAGPVRKGPDTEEQVGL